MGVYTTGTKQVLQVHDEDVGCIKFGCPIHNPSNHPLKDAPTHWREDRQLMERLCPHGQGHPDPDAIAFHARMHGNESAAVEAIHGCDGCCTYWH